MLKSLLCIIQKHLRTSEDSLRVKIYNLTPQSPPPYNTDSEATPTSAPAHTPADVCVNYDSIPDRMIMSHRAAGGPPLMQTLAHQQV